MTISIIAAVAENRVIGNKGKLPWRLSSDLKRFRELTFGRPVVMGRGTYESMGRPLPDRTNIVLSNDASYPAPGCIVVRSLEDALREAGKRGEEIFVIGGAAVYEAALPYAHKLYLTRVHAAPEGDRFFPEFDEAEWREVERRDFPADEKNEHDYTFIAYERIAPPKVIE